MYLSELESFASHGPGGEHSFSGSALESLGAVFATELGDKTFFLAAIFASKGNPGLVLMSSWLALAIMTVISAFVGVAFTKTILPSARVSHLIVIASFLYIGFEHLWRSWGMYSKGEGESLQDELEDAAEEVVKIGGAPQILEDEPPLNPPKKTPSKPGKVVEKKNESDSTAASSSAEEETVTVSPPKSGTKSLDEVLVSKGFTGRKEQLVTTFSTIFIMTFLAEIGDKSQLTTMALGAIENLVGVIAGGLVGHLLCTFIAILGGVFLAASLSERFMVFFGGMVFVGFAIHGLLTIPPAEVGLINVSNLSDEKSIKLFQKAGEYVNWNKIESILDHTAQTSFMSSGGEFYR